MIIIHLIGKVVLHITLDTKLFLPLYFSLKAILDTTDVLNA